MNNMDLLASSLEYMENNLCSDLRTEDVARACYCSKSTLEKLFRCVNNISVREYLIRRRMTKAARAMIEQKERRILDIALDYGYSSNESFTRAFKQIWNCKPSDFRRDIRCSELFPRLDIPLEEGDIYMRERRHVDISELYDLFKSRSDCYFVCCDIKSLQPINDISRMAGDLAILEAMNRMNDASGTEDIVFRIGGDEFALLTDKTDREYAESIAEKIKSYNGSTYTYEEKKIPLSIHVGIAKFESSPLKYNELFTQLHLVIKESK